MKQKIGKLFGVLVVGGAMMVQAKGLVNPQEAKENQPTCRTKMTLEKLDQLEEGMCPGTSLCIDGKSQEEILKLITEEQDKIACLCAIWIE